MNAVKTKIPRTPAELRAYLAVLRIPRIAIARAYGCDHAWVCRVLNEDVPLSDGVWEKLRRAIAEVERRGHAKEEGRGRKAARS